MEEGDPGSSLSAEQTEGRGGEEEAALRRYLCLAPGESAISRARFTSPELAASLGLSALELDIIFSALDADDDDVITLEQLLEQWPGSGGEGGDGGGGGGEDQGKEHVIDGAVEEMRGQEHESEDSSSFIIAGLESETRDCSDELGTCSSLLHPTENKTNDHLGDTGAKLSVASEDTIAKEMEGVGEYNRNRRRSSLLLQILERRASSPHPLLTSTPTSASSYQCCHPGSTLAHNSESLHASSSALARSPTSPPPPVLLSPLSPRRLDDFFPPTSSKQSHEDETSFAADTPSISRSNSSNSSSSSNTLKTHGSNSPNEPTSPTSPTSPTTPSPKAVKCDHSCVHPSKLTLTDLMAPSRDPNSIPGNSSSSSSVPGTALSGGCRDTHRHVRRKLRSTSSGTDLKAPLTADSSLQALLPKHNSFCHNHQNPGLGSSRPVEYLSPESAVSGYRTPDSSRHASSHKDFLQPPTETNRSSKWAAHHYSPIDGTTPTIRKLRPKSPRPAKAGSRKPFPVRGPAPMETLDLELTPLSKSSQEQVCELYQNLHTADNPELLTQFENIVLNVIHDVRQYQLENERLEKTYQREKDEHLKHLRRLEEEMEQQVQSVEERVRRQEKEKLESEKVELRNVLDSEIIMLQQNLTKLQADGGTQLDKGQEQHLLSLKKRLEEIQQENRTLKSDLTDAQTNLALVKSQMTSVKQKLEEKNHELEVENKTVADCVNEQDKLRRQLQMLHEANKTLLDTNDNLREMLDSSPVGQAYKRQGSTDSGHSVKSARSARSAGPGSPTCPRKGSVMSNYVDTHPGNRPPLLAFNSGMMPRFLNESCDEDPLIEDLGDHHNFLSPDSGHSTLRDLNDVAEVNDDTELDSISIQSDLRRGRRHKRHRANLKAQEEEEDDSHDEMESDPENLVTRECNGFRLPERPKRSPSAGSRGSNKSQRSLHRDDSVLSHSSRSSRASSRRQLPALPSVEAVPAAPAPPKDPDRVHRIYMAGDAAVGKTSFIFRICKGKFVANLSSTLGMDFYTKMLDVDGNNTVMELWDTAGQERFRAMTRSYFRRADGVLLLYDVTYERSFINIREWVNAIEEGAVKKLPIMLVGNKTDMRDEMEKQGRKVVRYADGLRLSKEIDALFIETSAKEGSNITEAVIELTRMLRTNQDLEVKSVGMQIHEMSHKKSSSSCCGRS